MIDECLLNYAPSDMWAVSRASFTGCGSRAVPQKAILARARELGDQLVVSQMWRSTCTDVTHQCAAGRLSQSMARARVEVTQHPSLEGGNRVGLERVRDWPPLAVISPSFDPHSDKPVSHPDCFTQKAVLHLRPHSDPASPSHVLLSP